MVENEYIEEERYCELCGKKLSGYNPKKVCYSHNVTPQSALDRKLKGKPPLAKKAKAKKPKTAQKKKTYTSRFEKRLKRLGKEKS